MKLLAAAVGLLALSENVSAFLPHNVRTMRTNIGTLGGGSNAHILTSMAARASEEDDNLLVFSPRNQAVSAYAASVVAMAALGFTVTPPPPVFAEVQTEKLAPQKQKVASEVSALATAKSEFAAASEALANAQKAVPMAQATERTTGKEVDNAVNRLEGAKKTLDASNTRLKTLKSNPKFDQKAISTAEGRVGKCAFFADELIMYGIFTYLGLSAGYVQISPFLKPL